MLNLLIETIGAAFAEFFVGKAVEKAQARSPRVMGWVALVVLVLTFALLVWMAVYFFGIGADPVGILMVLLAAVIVYVIVMSVRAGRKG